MTENKYRYIVKKSINIEFQFHLIPKNFLLQDSLCQLINSIEDNLYYKQEIVNIKGNSKITIEHAKILFPQRDFSKEKETVFLPYFWYPKLLFESVPHRSWICFAIYEQQFIVGFTNGHLLNIDQIYVDMFCIHPLFYQKGIGKNLSQFLFQKLKEYWPNKIIVIENTGGVFAEKCYLYGAKLNNYHLITHPRSNIILNFKLNFKKEKEKEKEKHVNNFFKNKDPIYICPILFQCDFYDLTNFTQNQWKEFLLDLQQNQHSLFKPTNLYTYQSHLTINYMQFKKCDYVLILRHDQNIWRIIAGTLKGIQYNYGYHCILFDVVFLYNRFLQRYLICESQTKNKNENETTTLKVNKLASN